VTGPVLETARLRLRPFERADVGVLHAHWTGAEVRRYLWDGVAIPKRLGARYVRTDPAGAFGGTIVYDIGPEELAASA